jgi:hypothetical protein
MPASQISRIVYINPNHIAALKAIPIGFAQETPMTRGRAQSFLDRLERANTFKRGEYRVRTFKDGDKERVMILHAGAETERETSRRNVLVDAEFHDRVRKAVLEQPDLTHHVKIIADAMEIAIDGHDKNRDYRQLDAALEAVRMEIQAERGGTGHWIQEKQGRYNVYKWQPT